VRSSTAGGGSGDGSGGEGSREAVASTGRVAFDRPHERNQLLSTFSSPPSRILVVTGPPNSGKTVLLRRIADELQLGDSVCFIDCREKDVSSPAAFAAVLAKAGLPSILEQLPRSVLEELGKTAPLLAAVVALLPLRILEQAVGPATARTPGGSITSMQEAVAAAALSGPWSLAAVLEAYVELLAAWERMPPASRAAAARGWRGDSGRLGGGLVVTQVQVPVLIIDEASELMEWSEEYPRDLKRLANFLLSISKARRRCHVRARGVRGRAGPFRVWDGFGWLAAIRRFAAVQVCRLLISTQR
jgi:hypothetical protein